MRRPYQSSGDGTGADDVWCNVQVGGRVDEIILTPDRWRLALGSKLEHNDFTGFEIQPQARSIWNVTPTQLAWASVARAVCSPN